MVILIQCSLKMVLNKFSLKMILIYFSFEMVILIQYSLSDFDYFRSVISLFCALAFTLPPSSQLFETGSRE